MSRLAIEWVSLSYVKLAQSVSSRPIPLARFSEKSISFTISVTKIISTHYFILMFKENNTKVVDCSESYEQYIYSAQADNHHEYGCFVVKLKNALAIQY